MTNQTPPVRMHLTRALDDRAYAAYAEQVFLDYLFTCQDACYRATGSYPEFNQADLDLVIDGVAAYFMGHGKWELTLTKGAAQLRRIKTEFPVVAGR